MFRLRGAIVCGECGFSIAEFIREMRVVGISTITPVGLGERNGSSTVASDRAVPHSGKRPKKTRDSASSASPPAADHEIDETIGESKSLPARYACRNRARNAT
jgi:hypothetical protein